MKSQEARALLLSLVAALAAASATWAGDRCTAPVPTNHCMIGTWQAESTNAPAVHDTGEGPMRRASRDMGENQLVFSAEITMLIVGGPEISWSARRVRQ